MSCAEDDSTPAGHWHAQATLAAMRLRPKRPDPRGVTDFPRGATFTERPGSRLGGARIAVSWLHEGGPLEELIQAYDEGPHTRVRPAVALPRARRLKLGHPRVDRAPSCVAGQLEKVP